jgi:hypothetical protein
LCIDTFICQSFTSCQSPTTDHFTEQSVICVNVVVVVMLIHYSVVHTLSDHWVSDSLKLFTVTLEVEDFKTEQYHIIHYCVRRCCCYYQGNDWNSWRGMFEQKNNFQMVQVVQGGMAVCSKWCMVGAPKKVNHTRSDSLCRWNNKWRLSNFNHRISISIVHIHWQILCHLYRSHENIKNWC